MHRASALFLFFFFTFVLTKSDLVSVLDAQNFETTLNENSNLLILFTRFSEDCTECQASIDAIDSFAEEGLDCFTAIVDCSQNQALCKQYDVTRIPSLMLFSENLAIYPYTKPFIYLEAVRNFVTRYSAPKTTKLSTVEEIQEFINDHQVTVAGFFRDSAEEKIRGSFRRTAAELFIEYNFLEILISEDDQSILEHFDSIIDSIVMFQSIGGKVSRSVFEGTVSRRRIANWIEKESPWIVREVIGTDLTETIPETYKSLPFLTVYLDYDNEQQKRSTIRELEVAAQSFRNRIVFLYMNGNSDDQTKKVFTRWGFAEGVFPVALISQLHTRDVFTHPQTEVNAQSITKFCNQFLQGEIPAHIIKQSLPEEDETSPVKTLVHDNYRSIVHDQTRDVVVYFYLPFDQCPHCEKTLQDFEEVAESLKNQPDLVFGKIDMYANAQVPSVRVTNFPAIQMYTMASKYRESIFEGQRTPENIRKWILEHLTDLHKFSDEERKLGLNEVY